MTEDDAFEIEFVGPASFLGVLHEDAELRAHVRAVRPPTPVTDVADHAFNLETVASVVTLVAFGFQMVSLAPALQRLLTEERPSGLFIRTPLHEIMLSTPDVESIDALTRLLKTLDE